MRTLLVIGSSLALAAAQTTDPVVDANVAVNASNETAHASINRETCRMHSPSNGVIGWYYQTYSSGPYTCSSVDSTYEWAMLNAYRSGGQIGVHWKYTSDDNDSDCLKNWKYYSSDGNTLLATVPRTTTLNDNRSWCALRVYRQGGVKGKQWEKCSEVCHGSGGPDGRV